MQFYMLFTLVILFISVVARYVKIGRNHNSTNRNSYLLIMGVMLFVIMGIRAESVGIDTQMYGKIFSNLGEKNLFSNLSINTSGFFIYRVLCKCIYLVFGNNYRILLLLAAMVTIGGIFYFIKNFSQNFIVSVLLFVFYFLYFNSWNGSRQYMAISVALLAIVFLNRENVKGFLLLMICAYLIHNTSIVLAIYLPIKYIKWDRRKIIYFSVIIFILLFLTDYIIPVIIRFFPRYLNLYMMKWSEGDMGGFGGVAQGRKAIVSFLFLFLVITSIALKKERQQNDWIFLLMMIIEIGIGIVLRHNSMMLRIQWLFSPFIIVGIPNCIMQLKLKESLRVIINSLLILIMLIPYYIQIIENSSGIVPYKCF